MGCFLNSKYITRDVIAHIVFSLPQENLAEVGAVISVVGVSSSSLTVKLIYDNYSF